ncbi:2Fe-2S iron-sulfur cluster binding domain-containing protein [Pseudomonas sp. J452]|uniref:2Fe-2S iron-sulfur cluster binding domain-containing protein n=1 Tax=Pseudomonas sp. J452 TaxID=2898441 RepID=UPI0021AD893A|nr:2Fe-2S iron-sulfur cluster binding domain-containing protein [Pseudomonas sp. J452]UUY07978.1 2Fe-2S iron-sulfur cluster binding domain-containing protein [Pseudomonas sp. J452]
MFYFLSRPRASRAAINGIDVEVQPRETLLQAALRQGIDFPHSCRVGGCASCKCRLVEGRVRELTESGYILSDAELDAGYILACQSVPRGDVRIEVDLARQQARRQVRGRVVAQERLTHDISRLVIQLDDSLAYQAGQYAELTLDSLPQQPRSFSFASPVQADGQVSFFIRRVPGGLFTGLVDEQPLLGQGVTVAGPLGDFHLRPGAAPLLLIAGGSGLAPLLAMLQDALVDGCKRPATLLFGAREERDLYALDAIAAIAAQWRAPFRFVPVLSAAAVDAPWQGARGLVTTQIAVLLEPGAHAYLCGPPAMIDSAVPLLRAMGVSSEHIHADRFTTCQDARPVPA